MEQHNISMLEIKKVVLKHQLMRLHIELKKDVIDEEKVNFIRKDIYKLQDYIDNFYKNN
jgi:hypothetical protein